MPRRNVPRALYAQTIDMRIYLIRHAQSTWQLAPGINLDTSLTPAGREQARLLGHWLATGALPEIQVGALLTSPLLRATETTGYLTQALSLTPVTLESLREAPFHVADELPLLDERGAVPTDYLPSARYVAFKAQARTALEALRELAESGNGSPLAVTHGGLIKTLLRVAAGTDAFCFRLCNAGVNTIEWRRGRWHLVHLNWCEYLASELRTW
jgi:broad specificity phosphatase PhoE